MNDKKNCAQSSYYGQCMCMCGYIIFIEPGLGKNLNSSLPFGQAALTFYLLWANLSLLFLFSW